jgi:hypothetical protein
MLIIKNSKSKEEKSVSEKDWEAIQKNPLMKNWFEVPTAKKPKELEEFEATKAGKTSATAKEEMPKNTSK